MANEFAKGFWNGLGRSAATAIVSSVGCAAVGFLFAGPAGAVVGAKVGMVKGAALGGLSDGGDNGDSGNNGDGGDHGSSSIDWF